MDTFFLIASDLVIILANIIIFSIMLDFKAMKPIKKIILSLICMGFVVAYTLCIYLADMPYIHASLICFTIPSLITFWIFSNIKDARFFLSFGIVDTISLIIAFTTKYITFYFNGIAIYLSFALNIFIYALIIFFGYKFFKKYAELMKFQKTGWLVMTISSFIIYFALYFFAAYPVPMRERLEYGPSYFVFCCVVISCYVVFFDSMIKTRKLHDQYNQLEQEKIYHKIAYTDALTGLYNRVYYIEKINEVERDRANYKNICCIVSDINDFKSINDRFGHLVGDSVLQEIAKHISNTFKELSPLVFRNGGDEFYTMLIDVDENIVKDKIDSLYSITTNIEEIDGRIITISSGYSIMNDVNETSRLSIEENFNIADKRMYDNKKKYKLNHPDMQPVID